MRTHLVVTIGLTLCAALGVAAGCGSEGGPPAAGERTGAQSDAFFVDKAPHFYTVRRYAICPGLRCTGWLVKELNGDEEIRVSDLDFSRAGFAPSVVLDALPEDFVLRGWIVPAAGPYEHRFLVRDAFRGMPGFTKGPGDAFYRVYCLNPACDEAAAFEVEAKGGTLFERLSVARATAEHASGAWLMDEVQRHGAIVAGTLGNTRTNAETNGGGAWWAVTLDASQVYVQVPYVHTACGFMHDACAEPLMATYNRNADLCLEFHACVPPALLCGKRENRPACAPGYALRSWPAEPAGCPAYACDPAFIHE